MNYLFRIRFGGEILFQREITIAPGRSFRRDFTDALAAFRKARPDVALHDPGVTVDLNPKGEA